MIYGREEKHNEITKIKIFQNFAESLKTQYAIA
jgi:hypothetical protein